MEKLYEFYTQHFVSRVDSNLRVTNLRVTNLRVTNLRVTNLRVTNLRVTNLRVTNLRVTNLRVMNLRVTNIRVTNLRLTNLRVTNLRVTNLRVTNLRVTNLRVTNLRVTNLRACNAVQTAIAASSNSKLLNAPPPLVDAAEVSLPRPYRSALSQLRSGYCVALNDYQFRVGGSLTATCPECTTADQTVPHIFACPAHPTYLSLEDLWYDPVGVAGYISSLPSFNYLPPMGRPPPEPPP